MYFLHQTILCTIYIRYTMPRTNRAHKKPPTQTVYIYSTYVVASSNPPPHTRKIYYVYKERKCIREKNARASAARIYYIKDAGHTKKNLYNENKGKKR